MTLTRLSASMADKSFQLMERRLTWIVPPLVIPALRYMQDSVETRDKLFIRDFTTYSIGAAAFFAASLLAKKGFQSVRLFRQPAIQNFAAFMVGLACNQLYAGVGAIKLSEWLTKRVKADMPADSAKQFSNSNVQIKLSPSHLPTIIRPESRPVPHLHPVGFVGSAPFTTAPWSNHGHNMGVYNGFYR
jgi:hypothetical protein